MGQFGRRWRQNAEEISAKAAGYDPEKMPDYLSDLSDLTEAFRSESAAIGKVAAVSESQLPVDPKLADYLRKNQALLRRVSDDMSEVVKHFMRKHEADMARHKAPRAGEEKWNV